MKKSAYKKVWGYYVCVIIISVLFSFWYFFLLPPKEVEGFITSFIESFNEESKLRPEDFLADTVNNHSFIKYYKDNPHMRLEISNTKRKDFNTYVTTVKVLTHSGSVFCSFHVAQTHSGYKLIRIPRIDIIKSCLPVMSEKTGKHLLHTVDIAGKKSTFHSLPGISLEANYPASITLLDNTIIEALPLTYVNVKKILSVAANHIETSLGKVLPANGILHVYEIRDGKVKYIGNRAIPPGTENVTLYLLPDGSVASAIYLFENLPFNTIRVAIGKTGFSGLIHEQVVIRSDEGFTITTKFPAQSSYSLGHSQKAILTRKGNGISVVSNGKEVLYTEDRLYICPEKNGCLRLYGIERAQSSGMGYTCYNGTIEVSSIMNGLSIVNEISLEEYLYSVVSSEMPVKFGPEPLKAQAVAARTYAVKSILRSGFSLYGANVDDSTATQVYNNVSVKNEAIHAVDATSGLVLLYDGQLADSRYFSTSCGYTASSSEVWEDSEGNFPGEHLEYLTALPQFHGKPINLSSDKQMRHFLEHAGTGFFDVHSPFFRWKITMTGAQAEAAICHNLKTILEEELPSDLGKLVDIRTVQRGAGGNIIHLLIKMTSGEYNVFKELNIRKVLQPVNRVIGEPPIILKLNDGSIRENFSMLPSSFAVIETRKGSDGFVDSITIKGGGFGHGAGMSQYGAYGLALSGYTFDMILSHYYPGTELKKLY